MNYNNATEVFNYTQDEIFKASKILEEKEYNLPVEVNDQLQATLRDLRNAMEYWGFRPELSPMQEEQFILSQIVLYGTLYVRSYTFCCEFWLIDTLGKYDGYKELRDFDFVPESIVDIIALNIL